MNDTVGKRVVRGNVLGLGPHPSSIGEHNESGLFPPLLKFGLLLKGG